jgi:pantetheine-phosphate adenylyltransferase
MTRIAIYPGSFDPITNGHIDVIRRALKIFDRLIVAVAVNDRKQPLFGTEERVRMIKTALQGQSRVIVDSFHGLLVDYAREQKASAVIRGIRAVSDFEYEFQMALMNRKLCRDIETVYLTPYEQYTYLNSSLVKEVARMGGSLKGLVPPVTAAGLRAKFRSRAGKGRICR